MKTWRSNTKFCQFIPRYLSHLQTLFNHGSHSTIVTYLFLNLPNSYVVFSPMPPFLFVQICFVFVDETKSLDCPFHMWIYLFITHMQHFMSLFVTTCAFVAIFSSLALHFVPLYLSYLLLVYSFKKIHFLIHTFHSGSVLYWI